MQPRISQTIVDHLKTQMRELIDRERIIPEQMLAELRKCLSISANGDKHAPPVITLLPACRRYMYLCDGEELGRAEIFLRDESKKLDEYGREIKRYHDMAGRIATDVERTTFAGLFEISHAPFVDTVTENIEHFKGLLLRYLVDKYQTIVKG